jgi:single-stranded-DNA-specific exonuclease
MRERANFTEEEILDLVALGTVADLAPLLGENRLLVIRGLAALNEARRPGLAALAHVSGLKPGSLTAESIGFGLGPRLNAAGRLAHAYEAARLLAAGNGKDVQGMAHHLNQLNQERRRLTAELSRQAEELIEPDTPLLFACAANFQPGVVGLVASRLAESYYRPAIVVEQGPEESRGSCRSIPEFHITEALDEVADLLVRHGGHAQAAGFTIKNENLDAFRDQMTAIAARELDGRELLPTITADAEISLGHVDWALQNVLAQLEPTGYANATPIFMSRNVHVQSHRPVGHDGAHLQLRVGDGRSYFQCIAFRKGEWAAAMPPQIDIVYTIGVNEWNGMRSLQLVVQDLRQAE